MTYHSISKNVRLFLSPDLLQNLDFNYGLEGKILSRVNVIQDLGIVHEVALKFYDHLDMVNSMAHNLLGFLMRNCKDFHNKNTILDLDKTLVIL